MPESVTREEFADVYDTHTEKIYRFIYYKTFRRETAEDLTSQTFLRALERIEQFDPGRGSITVWLYRIARNLVIDHFRARKSTVNIDDVWDLASSENVECDAENRMRLREIGEALGRLPAEQRDIVILRIWQDVPYREIALIMEKSEAACKMLFSRVMARLRSEVGAAVVLLVLFADMLL
jgi:RNA polymerase sigma-70 factor (ECF subfamily)